jgi:hypothetical protein
LEANSSSSSCNADDERSQSAIDLVTRVLGAEVVDPEVLREDEFARRWNRSHPQDEAAATLVTEVATAAGEGRPPPRDSRRGRHVDVTPASNSAPDELPFISPGDA